MQDAVPGRFRATVHYDGRDFHGWQIQPSQRTVQGDLEAAVARLSQQELRVESAGRTDRGVHSVGQEIAFPRPDGWDAAEMRRALNAVLPPDIWIERLTAAGADFHPRFDARARRYAYFLGARARDASPLRRGRVWSLAQEVDEEALRRSAATLPGERDFGAFAKAGQPERGTVCRVEEAGWSTTVLGDLMFTIVANRFLHHMVRYLVTTMVEIARGKREPGEIAALLRGDEAPNPPGPAPPEGLYLTGVRYADGWNRGPGVPGLFPGESEPVRRDDARAPDDADEPGAGT